MASSGRLTVALFIVLLGLLGFVNGRPYPQEVAVDTAGQQPPSPQPQQQYNEWKSAWQSLQSAFRHVGNWFVRQYKTVQSWFAKSRQMASHGGSAVDPLTPALILGLSGLFPNPLNRLITDQELERKVQDMVNFLGGVKDNINMLVQGAGAGLQAALQNVNNYYTDVVQFQQKMRSDVAASFQSLEDEWQRKVTGMYNSGLDKIVNAAQAAKTEPGQDPGAQQPQRDWQITAIVSNSTS